MQMRIARGKDFVKDSEDDGYPEGAPSLLASTYLAVQDRHNMIVGATKRPGLTAAEALEVSPV